MKKSLSLIRKLHLIPLSSLKKSKSGISAYFEPKLNCASDFEGSLSFHLTLVFTNN